MYGRINEQKKDTPTDTHTHTHTHKDKHAHTHIQIHTDKHTHSRRLIKKVTIIDEAKYKVKDRIIWKSIAYLA